MKKTFFLTLASFAFAIGLTCCSGGGGGDEVSPAANYLKGETILAGGGGEMKFQFADEFWASSTNVLPCTLTSGTGAREEVTVTIMEYTLAAGSSADSDNPEFKTMKLRVQYNRGEVGNDVGHITFWGFPSGSTNVSLGGKGALLNLTFADKKNGIYSTVVQVGATFTSVQGSGEGNKTDYSVNEDNTATPIEGEAAQLVFEADNGPFSFDRN